LSGSQAETVLKGLQVKLDHLQARLEARLKIDAREQRAGSGEDRGEPTVGYSGRGFQLSTDAAAILEQAQVEASENHLDFVDTLKYTHPVFSIFVPLLFLFIGGIGLPGGAVYINPAAIRKSGMRALASAAGPLATLLCAVICALPFLFGWHYALWEGHEAFWSGLGFLLFLQIMGLCLNLLPLPGLDGFGVMEPFLAPETVYKINIIRRFSFFLLFALLSYNKLISQWFRDGIWQIAMWINWDLGFLVSEGYHLFRFWPN